MWETLAKLIGVRTDQVEDALQDERRAQRQLSRRNWLLGSAALATSTMLPPLPALPFGPLRGAHSVHLPVRGLPDYWRTTLGASVMVSGAVFAMGLLWATQSE